MKKRLLVLTSLILLTILTLSLISAVTYECADGSELSEDRKEIDVNNRKSINGIGIGIIRSDETAVLNKYSADILTDAKKFSLTNKSREEDIELKKGEYTIKMLNATTTTALMEIDGNSETIEVGETESIGGLIVLISSTDTTSDDRPAVKGLIGEEKISLSNFETPSKIVRVNKTDYVIELFSASDTNAIVNVFKCEDESVDIIEIADEIEEEIVEENNETISINETEDEETPEEEINGTSTNETEVEDTDSESKKGSSSDIFLFILGGLAAIVFIIIFLIIMKSRKKNF